MAVRFLSALIVAMAIVSLWVPFLGREIEARWFAWPNIASSRRCRSSRPWRPAGSTAGSRMGGNAARSSSPSPSSSSAISASAISLFPYIVPPSVTIWQAANTVNSQLFALVGFSIVMPLTFLYTGYAYWVFRGKVAEEIKAGGYH